MYYDSTNLQFLVSDNGNNMVQSMDLFGNITPVAGNGTVGYADSGFGQTQAMFNRPFAVTANSTTAFISDQVCRSLPLFPLSYNRCSL